MSNIKFDIQGIGKLIKDYSLSVPPYQREYKWEEIHIRELITDIHNSISTSDKEYFLGTVVLSEKQNTKELEIVDGQQRITTIVIFLSAVRDFFYDKHEQKKGNSFQEKFISNYNTRSDENVSKLKLGLTDRAFFQEYIIDKDETSKGSKESHKRIIKAKEIAKEQVNKLAKLSDDGFNVIHDWVEFMEEKLKVVSITVPNDSNAYTIFETLNDRGLELAQIDLLKNHLYSRAGEKLDNVQNYWTSMTSKVESTTQNESIILTYIRHHWSSQYGLTREQNKELYTAIKSKHKTSSTTLSYVKTLDEDTSLYLAILNHNDPYWNGFNSVVKQYIETLNFFPIDQYRPLLLAILKKFSNKNEIEKTFKLVVSWMARNLITGKLGGGTLEKTYSEKAKDITEGAIKNASQLRKALKDIIPQDAEFKENFINATVSKGNLARYYLRAIENTNRKNTNPELLVNSNPEEVNLEHILSKTYNAVNWPNFTEDQHSSFYKRIGNLTLTTTQLNSEELKDKPFGDKKKYYDNSELWITKMITDKYNDWTTDTIKERQKELAEIAVETWSLKF
ncbi:MAG: DUF262 domain-containing protein [Nitrospinae bacterium]|nr:DUF262 domain-containing protein [Nitrospinota bacterium]